MISSCSERIKIYKEADTVEIGAKSGMGRGGMAAKITAARVAARGGVATCIASGEREQQKEEQKKELRLMVRL